MRGLFRNAAAFQATVLVFLRLSAHLDDAEGKYDLARSFQTFKNDILLPFPLK